MTRKWPLLMMLTVLLAACGADAPENRVHRAFYHWQSHWDLSGPERMALQKTGTQRLYLRFFDVDWSEERAEAIPVAVLDSADGLPADLEIVPVVFITNRAVARTHPDSIRSLAGKIGSLIAAIYQRSPGMRGQEVQIDCDWTSSTRTKYFALLEALRQGGLPAPYVRLSATIRLHQVKYAKATGVPPVDRGMLMYYNMGRLDDPEEPNSILNLEEGARYLSAADGYRVADYELELDVALPIFAWGVVLREGKPVYLLNDLRAEEADTARGLEKIGPDRFKVIESRYFRGEYLYRGDLIRTEAVSDSLLLAAAGQLARQLRNAPGYVALYHLDSLTISHYDLETFAAVWDAFR